MSDQPGADPELTPEQESAVRRLLAQARYDEPIPAEVGNRLDLVLAGLSRDETAGADPAQVIDLAARRRRRNAAALLAAAAAVIVAGFGIGQVIDVGGPSGSDAAGSAAGSADREARQLESGGAGDNSAADSGGETSPSDNSANNAAPELPAPLVLSSDSLERDVSRQLKRSAAAPGVQAEADALAAYGCPAASAGKYGLGELFPALYDGEPAVLVLRPATGSTQRADVLACGTADELDSVTIPAP